jgi:GMP synthase-like glutamine amidotransferase
MPIELTDEGKQDRLFAGLGPAPAFVSWHDDTFDVPAGAARLAGSAGCANHAFQVGERAYGLQFHPEVSTAMLEGWLEHVLPETKVDRAAFRDAVAREEDALRGRASKLIENFLDS